MREAGLNRCVGVLQSYRGPLSLPSKDRAPLIGSHFYNRVESFSRPIQDLTAMPVNLSAITPSDLHPVTGIAIGTAMAGVRKANRRDVTVVTLSAGATVAGVFTANRFCAAPVLLCREHLAAGAQVRAILVNTGNANAGTGVDGL